MPSRKAPETVAGGVFGELTLMEGTGSKPVYSGSVRVGRKSLIEVSIHANGSSDAARIKALTDAETRFLAIRQADAELRLKLAEKVLTTESLAGYQDLADFRTAHASNTLEALADGMRVDGLNFFRTGSIEVRASGRTRRPRPQGRP